MGELFMIRVAINGFGRIGRMVYRAGKDDDSIEFVAVNDLMDTETLAYLLEYDTVHGTLDEDVDYDDETLYVGDDELQVTAKKQPGNLSWDELGIDVVVESTGLFRTEDKASPHLDAGANKVLMSAPSKGGNVFTVVKGVNEHDYGGEKIVSNASCTTNSLAPLVKVLDDNFGVEKGLMTTTHAYTGSQNMIDGPNKDLRRGRSAPNNIVPTTTGAAIAVTEVLPHLEGKLDGMAMRVPVPDGSITDLTVEVSEDVTVEDVNDLFKDVSNHHLSDVLEYTEDPVVSSDILGNPHSSIVDGENTRVIDGNMVKLLAWYDNEWGYSNRMIDVIKLIHDA